MSGTTASAVAASIEHAVGVGDLLPGTRLPSIRALADHLDVANGTVARAYARLRDRGIVVTDGRRGTRVRRRSPATPRQHLGLDVPAGAIDLSRGNPDPALLPDLRPHLAAAATAAGLYGEDPMPHVHPGLADALTARAAADGLPLSALAGPAIVSGALDGIERALAVHLRPGDAVAVEDPGWPNLLDLVAALGLRPVPMPVDGDGPTAVGLADVLDRVEAVVVTSRAHNPTGAALSPRRRDHLRGVLADWDGLVVEDDHGGEASGVPLAALAGVGAHWVIVQSLSKSWGPDLRVAAVFGDPATVQRVAGRLRLGPGWVSRILQHTAWALLTDDEARATVAAAAAELARRRDALVDALADHGIAARGRSGLNVWVPVADETVVVAGLLVRGWGVAPGARYRLDSPPGIRVTAAAMVDVDMARRFAADLAAVASTPAGRGV
jgi:DNA-binding transcriptional MocR family regulator